MSKKKRKKAHSASDKPKSGTISTKMLWIMGIPLALFGVLIGYFVWSIESPTAAAFAFVIASLTGIPMIAAAFRGKRDIAFLAVFAWATIVFFARFIFGGGMLFGTDTMGLGYFAHSFYRDYILQFGSYPLWEQLMHGGMPFHSGMHGDVLYPTRILELLLPLHYALGFKLVLHVWLAGFFMFGFLRRLELSRAAAFFGGFAYMFGSFFVSYIYAGHDGKMFVITLLPLAFWALEAALGDGKLWRYLLFTATYALMIVSAHMQMAYFAAWGIGAYFVFRIIRMLLKKRGIKKPALHVGAFVLAVILAIGITAVQIYPPFKYLGKYSQRTQRTEESGYEWATSWSLHPEEIGSIVVPEFAGINVGGQNTYWGRNAFKLNSDYFGVVVLILAIGAIILLRTPRTWFFFGVTTFSTIYALGATTPFFHLFYAFIPQVKKFRGPSMLIFLGAFSAVILASYVVDVLQNDERRKELTKRGLPLFLAIAAGVFVLGAIIYSAAGPAIFKAYTTIFYRGIDNTKQAVMSNNISNVVRGSWLGVLVVVASLGALAMVLRKKLSPNIALAVLLLATGFDLWRVDKPFVQITDPQSHFGTTGAVDWLKWRYEKKPFRTLVLPRAFQDSYLALHGLEEVVLGIGHGNQLRTFDEFIGRSTGSRNLMTQPALALLNIEYIAMRGQQLQGLPVVYQEGNLYIHQNMLILPRAFPIYDWQTVSSPEEARNLIFLQNLPFDRKAAVEGKVPFTPTPIADSLYRPTPANVIRSDYDDFSVEVDMAHDGLLFLSENWYPEWHAYEGESELPIYRVNGTFRAVPLKKGQHKVRFVFVPTTLKKSLAVSIVALLFAVALFVVSTVLGKKKDLV